MKLLDLTGHRFGRLVVQGRDHGAKTRNAKWWCVCDCGTRISVIGTSLRGGATTSCGCRRREVGIEKAAAMREVLSRRGQRHQRLARVDAQVFGEPTQPTLLGARVVRGRRY